MHQIYQQEENILSRIISMLSMYHCLYLAQLCRLFPEVNNEQLTVLLRKLVCSLYFTYGSVISFCSIAINSPTNKN